jgi:hypothetical protein
VNRKQVKSNRLWKHWLHWLAEDVFDENLKRIEGYDPEAFREAFQRFQTHGSKALTEDEVRGIKPLKDAQKAKEFFLTSLAEESMEWWAKGDGWIYPWIHTLDTRKQGRPLDRLTIVAILRTMKTIRRSPHDFFERHPGISQELKARYFSIRFSTLSNETERLKAA